MRQIERKRRWLEGENEEAKKIRLEKEKLRKKQAREQQTGDEGLKNKKKQQERKRRWQEGETAEAKRARQEKDRFRKKQAREKKQTTSLQVNSEVQMTPLTKSIKQIVSNRDRFFKTICDGPSHACYACQKFCYKENARFYSCDEAKKLIVHQNVNSQLVTSEWFCHRCIPALNRNKVPSTL